MKKTMLWLVAMPVLLLAGCTMTEGFSKIGEFFLGHKETRAEVVSRLDTNKDGKVDADELAVSALDANHDGILQADEIDAGKKETDGSNIPGLILTLLATFGVPGVAAVKTILDQKKHLRAAISGIEDIKVECMSRAAGSGSPLSADNWAEIKAKLQSAVAKHSNPDAFNALVQKVTAPKV